MVGSQSFAEKIDPKTDIEFQENIVMVGPKFSDIRTVTDIERYR